MRVGFSRLPGGEGGLPLQPVDVSGAAQPQQVGEFDRFVQVGHGAAHDPQRMGLLEPHLTQLVRADVLNVPSRGVELQPALSVDVGNPQWPLDVEHVGVRIGNGHHRLGQARRRAPDLNTAAHGS